MGKREEVYDLWEMYEDIKDKEIVNGFEKKEDAGNTSFSTITDLL